MYVAIYLKHIVDTVPAIIVSPLEKIVLKTCLYFFGDISVFLKKPLEGLLIFAPNIYFL